MYSERLLACIAFVTLVVSFDHDASIELTIVACTACIIRAMKEVK